MFLQKWYMLFCTLKVVLKIFITLLGEDAIQKLGKMLRKVTTEGKW